MCAKINTGQVPETLLELLFDKSPIEERFLTKALMCDVCGQSERRGCFCPGTFFFFFLAVGDHLLNHCLSSPRCVTW